MNGRESHCVTRHLRPSTPSGELLPTDTVWVRSGDPPTMRVLLPWHGWERVVDEGLFGLDSDRVPTDLRPDSEVVVEATLRTGIPFPDDTSGLRTELAKPDSPLRSTASWSGTDVLQARPLSDAGDPTDDVFTNGPLNGQTSPSGTVQQASPCTGDERGDGRESGLDRTDRASTVTTSSTTEPAAPAVTPDTTADGSTASGSETAERDQDPAVDPAFEAVVDGIESEGWPYAVDDDGPRIRLEATIDDEHWAVRISPLTADLCIVSAVYPQPVDLEDDELASALLSYNGTIRRGGFAFDEERRELTFRTPFAPATEPVVDAVAENVTAVAEHL